MSDEPDNLTLVYLRRLDGKMDGMNETLQEVLLRLARLEAGQARIRRDQGSDAEYVAHLRAEVDRRLGKDVDRINRRLDLTDA